MLLNPIQNLSRFDLNWIQTRPVVTQQFGLNPQLYPQMDGHPGLDLRAAMNTPVFAPIDGIVKIRDSGSKGYGKHIFIRNSFKDCEVVLAHLSNFEVIDGQRVSMGDLVGESGNTGFSTAPHFHFGFRLLKAGNPNKVYDWDVMNFNNGYNGFIDPLEYLICWKGTLLKNTL